MSERSLHANPQRMATTCTEQLEKKIEQLIRDHIAEVRRRAAAAVERGFASSSRPKPAASRDVARRGRRRRAPDEIDELGERLYSAVCAHPGATMATLAPEVGASARELNRPMHQLKRTGRLRSAGQRQATRYFPMTPKSAR